MVGKKIVQQSKMNGTVKKKLKRNPGQSNLSRASEAVHASDPSVKPNNALVLKIISLAVLDAHAMTVTTEKVNTSGGPYY